MYIIVELQTTNGQTANIVQTKENLNEAMSAYHMILANASVSSVEYHTAVVMDVEGKYIARECYKHPIVEEQIDG